MRAPMLLRALCPKASGWLTGGSLSLRRVVRPPKHKFMAKRGRRDNRESIPIRPVKIHVLMLISI